MTNPTESTFLTSSYVKTPAIFTFPPKLASPVNVDIPPTFKFLERTKSVKLKLPPLLGVGAPVLPIYL